MAVLGLPGAGVPDRMSRGIPAQGAVRGAPGRCSSHVTRIPGQSPPGSPRAGWRPDQQSRAEAGNEIVPGTRFSVELWHAAGGLLLALCVLVGKPLQKSNARGSVKKIYPSGFTKMSSLGVLQQRVPVLVDFDNSKLGLRPGYELDVKIVVAAKDDALLLPSEAVFAKAEGPAVFVVENGRAQLRTITTGLKGDDDYEVTDGLEPGDAVILRPPSDIGPGARVASRAQ